MPARSVRLISAWAVGALVLGGAGYVAGARFGETAVPRAIAVTPATVTVESGSLSPTVQVEGEVVGATVVSVVAALPPGAERAVVTSTPLQAGLTVRDGQILATIADRPLAVVSEPVAFYRDLRPGDVGPDVARMQAMLARFGFGSQNSDAEFGEATERNLRRWYESLGFPPPSPSPEASAALTHATEALAQALPELSPPELQILRLAVDEARLRAGAWLPLEEIVEVPAPEMVVEDIAPQGSVLETGTDVVATLRADGLTVSGRLTISERELVSPGDPATLTFSADGSWTDGIVAHVGTFQPGAAATDPASAPRPPGHDIQIELTDPSRASDLEVGRFALITIMNSRPASNKGLIVPLAAIRHRGGDSYVEIVRDEDTIERFSVGILAEEDGMVELATGAGLEAGDEVIVGP